MEKETWKKPQLGDVAGGGQMALRVRSELAVVVLSNRYIGDDSFS